VLKLGLGKRPTTTQEQASALLALWQEMRALAPSERLEGLLSLQSEAEYLETLDLVAREMADA
jgi:hypothetical protein